MWNRFFNVYPINEPSTFYSDFAKANDGIIAAIREGVLRKDAVTVQTSRSPFQQTFTKADAEKFLTALPSHFYRSEALERMLSFQTEIDMNKFVMSRLFGRKHLTFVDS